MGSDNHFPVRAKVGILAKASVSGNIKDRQQSYVIFGVIGVILFGLSLASKYYVSSLWSDVGCLAGLAIIAVPVIKFILRDGKEADEEIRANIIVEPERVSVENVTGDPSRIILKIANILVSRKKLPLPDGKTSNDPTNKNEITRYSEEDRNRVGMELERKAVQHEAEIKQAVLNLRSTPSPK